MSDFQHWYGLDLLRMLRSGEAGRALSLIRGLLQNPESLTRARYFEDNPVESEAGMQLTFSRWGPELAVLTAIYNAVIATSGDKHAEKHMLQAPTAKRKPKLFARTLAEFDENRFMAIIAGGKR